MTPSSVNTEAGAYLTAVERLLDDLPEDDRRELLEDLEEHLTEVAAEGDGTLADRLGPPDVYASELRASAGLPPRADVTEPAEATLRDRARASSVGRSVQTAFNAAPVRAVRAFLPDLKPGWWVLRGYMAAVAIDYLVFAPNPSGGFPWPSVNGSSILGLALIAACIWLSVVAGRRAVTSARVGWLGLAASVVIIATFLAAWPRVHIGPESVSMVQAEPEPFGFGFLQHGDGSPITAICAYGEDGDRLKEVQLFDQDARPIVESRRGKLEFLMDKVKGDISVVPREEKLIGPETGAVEQFECPKKLEDLQSKQKLIERGRLVPRDLPPKLRPFVE